MIRLTIGVSNALTAATGVIHFLNHLLRTILFLSSLGVLEKNIIVTLFQPLQCRVCIHNSAVFLISNLYSLHSLTRKSQSPSMKSSSETLPHASVLSYLQINVSFCILTWWLLLKRQIQRRILSLCSRIKSSRSQFPWDLLFHRNLYH